MLPLFQEAERYGDGQSTSGPPGSRKSWDAQDTSDGFAGSLDWWRPPLVVPVLWLAFAALTGNFADNLRYSHSLASFALGAAFMLFANFGSILCLLRAFGAWWWHLLALPMWLFLLTEVAITLIYILRVLGMVSA